MKETIDKAETLNVIRSFISSLRPEATGLITDIYDAVNHLPSAQPKRMTGKWIYDGDCYICNKCGTTYSWWADSQTSNYCPNCGANMKGDADD